MKEEDKEYFSGIKDGVVVGTFVCSTAFAQTLKAAHGFDEIIDVTKAEKQPGPGWKYKKGKFKHPDESDE